MINKVLILPGIFLFAFLAISVHSVFASQAAIYCQDIYTEGCYADDFGMIKDREGNVLHVNRQGHDDFVVWIKDTSVRVYAGESIDYFGPNNSNAKVVLRYQDMSGTRIATFNLYGSMTKNLPEDGYLVFQSGDLAWEYSYIILNTCPDSDGDGFNVCPANAELGGTDRDCDDTDPMVNPGAIEIPGNGIDDDCSGNDQSTVCNDGQDNDNDGLIDTDDPGCSGQSDGSESDGTSECQDGIDNDNDGAADYPQDFSCSSPQDNNEYYPHSECQDGIDNDMNSLTDTEDPSCFGSQDNDESGFYPDINAPVVAIEANPGSPTNSQPVLFTATSEDDDSIEWTRIFIDGVKICENRGNVCSALGGPYSMGYHSYYAESMDSAGNIGTSAIGSLNVVAIPFQDTEFPQIETSHYPNNPSDSEITTLTATAWDNAGISEIEIIVDGQKVMECNDVSVCVVTNIYSQGQHTYYSYATDTSGNSVQSDVNSVIVVARETDPDPDPIPEECGIDITGLDVSGDIIYYSLRNAGSITETIDYSIKVNGAIIQSGSLSLASGSTRSEQKSYSFGYGSYVVTLQAESDCGVDDSQTITHTRFRPYSCKNPNGYEGEERCDYSEKQRLECRDGYWVRVSGYYDYCENDDDCTSRYLNDYRCDGDVVQRKYRYSDCETEWRDWEVCDYDCYQGKCTSNRYPYDRCTADWKCIDSSHRAYQYSDCSWGNSYYCHYGCDDGYCESREYQCTAGWKCKESNNKAYQYSDCSWGQSYYCPKGCSGGACYVQPNPPRPEPPSDRCGIEIENLRYSNNVLQGETAFVEFNSRNTGRYSDTITYKLIVDSVLVDSETRSLSSGSMYFKRFEYRPVAGQHGLRIVAEANCGASDVRLASMVVNGRGSPLPPIPPVYPEITSIDVTPKQLDIVPFESKVFAIEIDSAISQSFTFDIVGMESDWISFSSVVYVGKGEKNVYVYVSPQDDGIFPLTINVKALTENREFSRVVRVYVSQPGEPACGLFSQPLSYSDKSPTTSQRPISGLVIAGDTPYWFAGLLIVAIIVALFVLREFMKRREKKTEGFAAQEINNQQYPYHVSS